MIHIFIGTKAQYIKTAPFIRLLDKNRIHYNLIDSGQHANFSIELRRELNIREADICLKRGSDVDTLPLAFLWAGSLFMNLIFRPDFIRKNIFKGEAGVCVVHGDTPSTLIAVLMAKRAKLKVAHIEAGLRSYNYLNPFPEEIIRIIAMKLSDYLFTPNEEALKNLQKMRCGGEKINLGVNTNIESLRYSLSQISPTDTQMKEPYALMTFHRCETVLNKKRLQTIIDLASFISARVKLVFVMHSFTEKYLTKYGLLEKIRNNNKIIIKNLLPHKDFLYYLKNCDFVLTDGGSIQEEAFYLDKPCLVLRKKTERREGLGENVVISDFDTAKSIAFIEKYKDFKRKSVLPDTMPSEMIFEKLKKYS